MIKSMTGYGKAEEVTDGKKITVELRAVNSKTLDISFKIPTTYREKENLLRNELMRVVQRGKIEVAITAVSSVAEPSATVNKALFTAYYTQFNDLLKNFGSSAKEEDVVSTILRMPDVLETTISETTDKEWNAMFSALQKALTAFEKFRIDEGKALMNDICSHVALIQNLLEAVKTYETQRIETVKQRMDTNLQAFMQNGNYDKNRFEQELIYYLEKMDITEEKIRLKQHCEHFLQTADNEETPGRKLGFIAQEMGREINTLGSKANHADIQKIVIQMKDELEKIKEQLLNVL